MDEEAEIAERERKYQEWVRKKDVRDKAMSLLGELDESRADSRASLREVGVALCAVDMTLLGVDKDIIPESLIKSEHRQAVAKEKNMRGVFVKFTMEHHSFTDVRVAESEYNGFSGAVKELFQDPEVDEETGKKVYTFLSLKYNFPAIGKPGGAAVRGLTNDQKLQNSIFNRECRRMWKEVREDMCARVAAFQASGGKASSLKTTIVDAAGGFNVASGFGGGEAKGAGGDGASATADAKDSSGSGEAKSDAGGNAGADSKSGGGDENEDGGNGRSINPERLASRALLDLSIRKLKGWIEDDDDKAMDKKKEEDRERREDAKRSHEQFVRHKDSLRIRLPDADVAAAHKKATKGGGGRMGFGGAVASQRQVQAGAKSTVDLMMSSGLKYVHATKKGRGGMDGDLETCRKELMNMGFVSKENFDLDVEEDETKFSKATFRKAARQEEERKEKEKKEKEDRAKSFDAWATQKDMRAQAARLLTLIDAPLMNSSSMASGARGHESEDSVVLCLDVGRALKKVDLRLIENWASWCAGIITFNTCLVLWDYFPPVESSSINFEETEERKRKDVCRRYGVRFVDQKYRRSDKEETKGGDKDEDEYGDDFDGGEETASTMEMKREGVRYLMEVTRDARQEETLKEMLSKGTAPKPPKLTTRGEDDIYMAEGDADVIELVLRWEPAAGDLVSFYSLEMAQGPVGSGKAEHKYQEIFRDPKDASPDSRFDLHHVVRALPTKSGFEGGALEPATTYSFRLRGLNGFGAGDFSYAQFTTRPAAPAPPRVIRLAHDSVTLRWVFSASFFKALEQLKSLFDLADRDGSGQISREELLQVVTEARTPEVRALLAKVQKHVGGGGGGYDALFDQLESDDDNQISWDEFERFFMNAGWTGGTGGSVAGSVSGSMASLGSMRTSGGGSGSKSNSKMTYVLEQCEDEFANKYSSVIKTGSSQGTISRLESGKSYRFRVYAVNTEGVRGPPSTNVIVHTMLETPLVPLVAKNGIFSRRVVLHWRGRHSNQTTRDPRVVKQMFGQWTGAGADEEGAVSVEAAFSKYDQDMSGFIDASELAYMLDDLGVEVTEERLREAFEMLDTDGNGVISFDEFSSWWSRDEVLYTLKRSDAIPATLPSALVIATKGTGGSVSGSVRSSAGAGAGRTSTSVAAAPSKLKNVPMPYVSYRGKDARCEIAGLEPNQLYHFKQRYVGSRSDSALSLPLVLMTAPERTTRPMLIRLTNTMAWVKWYPGKAGAFKFVVQAMWDGQDEWAAMFEGKENTWKTTTLTPSTEYKVRVVALNEQGGAAEASEPLVFTTRPRNDTKPQLTPRNADSTFVVECTGDICVGDTVLITERLYTKASGNDGPGNGLGGGTGRGAARMNMSVTSLGGAAEPAVGTYIGEYTMAAHVVRDNHRKIRDDPGVAVGGGKFARRRMLGLEVVWQRGSNEACTKHALQTGAVVERLQSALEQFEVFRCTWIDEQQRSSLGQEWGMLEDCFGSNPHASAI